MRRLMRASGQCAREAWDGVWRNPTLSALSGLSIGVSLYVFGLFLLLAFNLTVLVDALGRDMQVQIYFADSAGPEKIDGLRNTLVADPAVAEVRLISSEEARHRFQQNFPALKDLPETVGGDIFPVSFELVLREGHRDPASVARLARSYQGAAGVEEVRYDQEWVRRMAGFIDLVRHGGYGLSVLLLGAVMVTVGAMVRLTILARRDEIDIMRLVGATAAFVRGPFLLGAAAQGLAGGALAVGALLLTHHLVVGSILFQKNPFMSLILGRFLPAGAVASLTAGGAVLGLVAAALALRRAGTP